MEPAAMEPAPQTGLASREIRQLRPVPLWTARERPVAPYDTPS